MNLFERKNRWVLHLAFWILYHAVFFLLLIQIMPWKDCISRVFFSLILHLVVAYTNWFVLIPNFFYHKKYIIYFVWIILLILLSTFVRVWLEKELAGMLPIVEKMPSIRYSLNFFSLNMIWITSSLFKLLEDYVESIKRENSLKMEKLETELKYLKHQINPHFLFNTLNNLYSLVYRKSAEAAPLLLKLSSTLRYMLYECNEDKVPLKKEINYLQDCIELQALGPEAKSRLHFDVDVQDPSVMVEPLLFINFLENAFKHGSLNEENGYIRATLRQTANHIHFTISNNKISQLHLKDSTQGIGLGNVKQRLQNVYPGKHSLEITDTVETYTIHLSLQI